MTFVCAVAALLASPARAQNRQKAVLTLYATRLNAPVTVAVDRAIHRVLDTGLQGNLDYYSEQIDLARFPEPGYPAALREFLKTKYSQQRFDVIIATSGAMLEFATASRNELFPGVPVVFNGGPGSQAGPQTTGITSSLQFKETLDLALTLQPDVERILVVTGVSAWDKSYETLARQAFESFENRLTIAYSSGLSMPALLRRVAELPAHSLIYFLSLTEDSQGGKFVAVDALDTIAAVANAPIYAWHSIAMNHGIVGGSLQSGERLADAVGTVALRVLAGQDPATIPVGSANLNVIQFDWRQLRRWGLDERRLPPGAEVLYRQPNVWQQYRDYIFSGAALLLVQAVLIGGLLLQRSRRLRVERELRESESRFRLMADTAPVMVWQSDRNNNAEFFNRTWLEFTGRGLDEEVGTGWAQGIHPDDVDRCLDAAVTSFVSQRTFHLEYRLRSAGGAYRWVLAAGVPRYDSHGEFAGYIGSCVDITERRQAEQSLQDSEERYALATAAGAVSVWDWSLVTNAFYVDPQINLLLGYDAADAPNSVDDWKARLHADDRQLLALVQECIDNRTDSFELEHRLAHQDGGFRWCVARGTVMRRADGSPFRVVGTETDITERKRVEEVVRENEAGLRASHAEIQHLAGRLIAAQEAERTRIARDLHDDVSQQLAGISIALSTLKRDIRGSNDGVRVEIASLQQRTIALAENVRHLSHALHPGVLEHAGLVAVLSAHCADLRRQHPLDVHFTATGTFDTLDRDDALCLYRVAQESLRNVLNHSGASHADVRLAWVGNTVQLTISDDGRGFDALETRRRSAGLGLVSINERVRLAGGSASITTELNKGTRVQVVIAAKHTANAQTPGTLGERGADLTAGQDAAAS